MGKRRRPHCCQPCCPAGGRGGYDYGMLGRRRVGAPHQVVDGQGQRGKTRSVSSGGRSRVMRRKWVCVRDDNKALMVGQVTVNADQYRGTLLGIEDDGSNILNIARC